MIYLVKGVKIVFLQIFRLLAFGYRIDNFVYMMNFEMKLVEKSIDVTKNLCLKY